MFTFEKQVNEENNEWSISNKLFSSINNRLIILKYCYLLVNLYMYI